VTHPFRFARFFYWSLWALWRRGARRIPTRKVRESYLSVFGPLSNLLLFVAWVVVLIIGFALLQWGIGTPLIVNDAREPRFGTYLYMSGETLFTLGYGDVTAGSPVGRMLSVFEAGMGFGFLAVVIGYLPVFYAAYSSREVTISLLDARAGSPPSASEAILRAARAGHASALDPFLAEWERWSAQLLESHLSFPQLSFYRSQHDNQSWLAALTTVLDISALLIAGARDGITYQARLTFAMARHAAVDLALVFSTPPSVPEKDRLPEDCRRRLWESLREAGLDISGDTSIDQRLAELRRMYEPFVHGMSKYFLFDLPEFVAERKVVDNWQTSAWMRRTAGIDKLPTVGVDEHFD
jgi:hypothetical protein